MNQPKSRVMSYTLKSGKHISLIVRLVLLFILCLTIIFCIACNKEQSDTDNQDDQDIDDVETDESQSINQYNTYNFQEDTDEIAEEETSNTLEQFVSQRMCQIQGNRCEIPGILSFVPPSNWYVINGDSYNEVKRIIPQRFWWNLNFENINFFLMENEEADNIQAVIFFITSEYIVPLDEENIPVVSKMMQDIVADSLDISLEIFFSDIMEINSNTALQISAKTVISSEFYQVVYVFLPFENGTIIANFWFPESELMKYTAVMTDVINSFAIY